MLDICGNMVLAAAHLISRPLQVLQSQLWEQGHDGIEDVVSAAAAAPIATAGVGPPSLLLPACLAASPAADAGVTHGRCPRSGYLNKTRRMGVSGPENDSHSTISNSN